MTRHLVLAMLLGGASIAVVSANPGGETPSLSKQALKGSYKVTELRAATDTPSTIATQRVARRYLGARASFGKRARWRDGIACRHWNISPKLQASPTDVSLGDLLTSRTQAGWADLVCDSRTVDRIFVIDRNRFLSRTPNGATWLLWSRQARINSRRI